MTEVSKITVRVKRENQIYGAPGGGAYKVGDLISVAKVPYGWRNHVEVVSNVSVENPVPVTGEDKDSATSDAAAKAAAAAAAAKAKAPSPFPPKPKTA